MACFLAGGSGCSHSREFARAKLDDGTKSDWVTRQETAVGILSPSQKYVYQLNKKTGETRPVPGAVATGNGATGNALLGIGTYFGLREVGRGLSHSGDRNTINQTGGGARAVSDSESHSDADANVKVDSQFIGPKWPPGHNKPWK